MDSHPMNGNGHPHGFKSDLIGIRDSDAKALRQKIVSAVNEAELSAGGKMKALNECRRHLENRRTVEGTASEAGLRLSGFLSNDTLELFYAVKQGRHDSGFISKGWDDPGFRVGEVLMFPSFQGVSFIWTGEKIKRFCATNGIGVTFEQREENTEVVLDGVIYMEGFNQTTFLKTLDALNMCVEKIDSLTGKT